jgi:hypothetical protein
MPTIPFLVSPASSDFLPLSVDLILGNKKKSGGDKLGEYVGGISFWNPLFPQKLLYLYCRVRSHVVRQEEPVSSSLKLKSYSTKSLNEIIQYFLFHYPKSHSTISLNKFTNCFNHVKCLNGFRLSTAFVIFEIFAAVPKSCISLKNPCTRESVVTINLFYQVERFRGWFARLERKRNILSLLHYYERSQRSTRYKILNTTDHERQKRSDWPFTGNTMEESTCKDKLKHVPTCFQIERSGFSPGI